jgi:predicted amidohydrolase YtcJ
VDGSYGALVPGMAADLLLFRWDEDAARLDVVATIAAGRVVYRAAPAA